LVFTILLVNLVDIILIIPLAYGLIKGLYKGLINELASLIALLAGVGIAYTYYKPLSLELQENFLSSLSETELNIVSFTLIFLLVALIVFLIGKMITKLLSALALGLFNRLLGGIFGLLKVLIIMLMITALLNPFIQKQAFYKDSLLSQSFVYQKFSSFSQVLFQQVKESNVPSIEI